MSGFVSLTLTPMLSSRFLRSEHGQKHGAIYNRIESFYDWLLGGYERSLAWVMRAPAGYARVFGRDPLVATVWLFWSTPKGLFPTDDTGQLLATTEAAEGVSFDALVERQQEVAAVVKDPDVRSVTSSVGTTAAANQGQLTIDLKPIDERKRSADRIARDLRSGAADRARHRRCSSRIRPRSRSAASRRRASTSTRCRAATSRRSTRRRARSRRGCASCRSSTDVTSDLLIENPQVTVDIDREQAGQLGVSASEIENTLYDAFGQRQVSTIYTSTNEYWVVMELLPEYQPDVEALGKLWVRSSRGPLVPLSTVARFNYSVGPGDRQSLGPAAVGHDLVQPRARRVARHRG